MPIWVRRFTFQKLKEHYNKQQDNQKEWEKAKQSQKAKIHRPGIEPSYSTKTSPK